MARRPPDLDVFLCERCGYPLDAVRTEQACPECGRSIASSLPSARTGSPWQRAPSLGSWSVTGAKLLFTAGVFRSIRISRGSSAWLLRVNLLFSAVLVSLAVAERGIDALMLRRDASLAGVLGSVLIVTPVAYVLLWVLTAIERAGLRYFGNRRGGRLTPEIAAAATAHASYGWVIAGVLAIIGAFLGHVILSPWYRASVSGSILSALPPRRAFGLLGFFGGLVVFETLSFLGANRCRFANLPTAESEATLDEHVSTTPNTTDSDRD
ncbi:MAG: hypothetical protein AAFR96_02310 [Planctomycetota bacterium]